MDKEKDMEFSKEQIKARIIRKLVRWRKWGGAHTENIFNGLPRHLRGEKVVKETIQDLIQSQWLLAMMKTGEIHYALNPRKAKEILQFYETYCQDQE
mgnify:CR=1 FL=1